MTRTIMKALTVAALVGLSALSSPHRLKPATVGADTVGAAWHWMAAGAGAAPAIGAQA